VPEQFRLEGSSTDGLYRQAVSGSRCSGAQCHTHKFRPLTQTNTTASSVPQTDAADNAIVVYTAEQLRRSRS